MTEPENNAEFLKKLGSALNHMVPCPKGHPILPAPPTLKSANP